MTPLAAYRDDITQLVKLKIWHIWDLVQRGEDSAIEALDTRVDIMRRTTLCHPGNH